MILTESQEPISTQMKEVTENDIHRFDGQKILIISAVYPGPLAMTSVVVVIVHQEDIISSTFTFSVVW